MFEQKVNDEVAERARKVKLLLMDCDGVLTDGRLYYSENGEALKVFHVRDGQGLVEWHRNGFRSGIITGRRSQALEFRADELGIDFLKQASTDKDADFRNILADSGLSPFEVAFIGDDIPDLVLFGKVGLSFAVADAHRKLLASADIVTDSNGGFGAVREAIDYLLYAKGLISA